MSGGKLTRDEVAGILRSQSITLEEILWLVDGERRSRVMLKNPKPRKGDGRRELLTKRGSAIYSRLVNIVCACSELTGGKHIDDIIRGLDEMTTE